MLSLTNSILHKTIVAGLMVFGLTTVAIAQDAAPATGLGQAWPNTPDISTSTRWHVYRFERDGIRYIQVNDLQGKVRAAVAETQGVAFALPVGVDAQNVAIDADSSPTDLTQVVYHDDRLSVMAEPQLDGTTEFTVQVMICDLSTCVGGRAM